MTDTSKARDREQMNLINKNTSISVGLGVTVATLLFWSGLTLGKVQSEQQKNGQQIEKFVPRTELQLMIENLQGDLDDIQETQREILLKLNDD